MDSNSSDNVAKKLAELQESIGVLGDGLVHIMQMLVVKESDLSCAAMCIAAINKLLRHFASEDVADKVMDAYTGGAYSISQELRAGGMGVEDAARMAAKAAAGGGEDA